MKTNQKFIGIDVSKDTLDVCILTDSQNHFVIKNTKNGIIKFFEKNLCKGMNNFIFIENTGKYSWLLMEILSQFDCKFYVINPLHMKRSLGLVRGKNDKVDALRIAQFIKKNHTEIKPYIPQREEINTIQVLLAERRFKVKQRKQLATKSKDNEVLSNKLLARKLTSKNNILIRALNKQIKELEEEIKALIAKDKSLNKINKQLTSIPDVGNILSWHVIIKTNEFKSIKDPRKLACYAGVAPFANSSGTSVFGKNRVSLYADKSLKSLLHMGALSTIRHKNDLSEYYKRKVEEGKNKMSVLNAVRNKIIHIIFALIKNESFYQNRLVSS